MVIGNEPAIPLQPLKIGVITIEPVMFDVELFAGAFQEGIFPVPFAPNPIAGVEFVQV